MKFFVVTYVHPDSEGPNKYLLAHVAYLENLLKEGTLRASGPFISTPHKSAMLILSATSRKDVLDVIAKEPLSDPGARHRNHRDRMGPGLRHIPRRIQSSPLSLTGLEEKVSQAEASGGPWG